MAETLTFKGHSPCWDSQEIAKDIGVDVSEVDNALIEKWVREKRFANAIDTETAELDLVCHHALWSSWRELVKRVKNFAPEPGENDHCFHYEYEGHKFLMTIEHKNWDVHITAEICFEVGS